LEYLQPQNGFSFLSNPNIKTLLLSLNTFDLRSLSTGFALVGLAPLGFG
jgi:hypothetical protein